MTNEAQVRHSRWAREITREHDATIVLRSFLSELGIA